MGRLYLVRHGRAEADFGVADDPGLDEVGRQQAEAVVRKLGEHPRVKIVTSPLLRARQTAAPLAAHWRTKPVVEEIVAEIPSPRQPGIDREKWLMEFMTGMWSAAPTDLERWRDSVVSYLVRRTEDEVIFTHFVAVNVAAGAAINDDHIAVFKPDNGSVTVIDVVDGKLKMVERGREAFTRVI